MDATLPKRNVDPTRVETLWSGGCALIEVGGVQWLETATCERGLLYPNHYQDWSATLVGRLLAALMMIDTNGPDIQAEDQVKALILEAVNAWRNYKKRVTSGSKETVIRGVTVYIHFVVSPDRPGVHILLLLDCKVQSPVTGVCAYSLCRLILRLILLILDCRLILLILDCKQSTHTPSGV